MNDDSTTSIKRAAQIMGSDFHGVDAHERCMNIKLSRKDKKLLSRVPFSAEVLEACKGTHMLVVCSELSLIEIDCVVHYRQFEHYPHEQPQTDWYLVRKNEVPNSVGKDYEDQYGLMTDEEYTPSASVMAQCISIHYMETGERLFNGIGVRVSDVDHDGSVIAIIQLDKRVYEQEDIELDAFICDEEECYENVGLASAKEPSYW